MKLSRNSKIFINYFLGPVLFVWLSWSIYRQIIHQPGLQDAWNKITTSLHGRGALLLAVTFILMLVNWSIEALKWKIAVRPVQRISFLRSLQAIFSGVSFSVTTPNRIGEYIGRLLYMEEGNRLRAISVTIVGSVSQLIITMIAGLAGLLILQQEILNKGLVELIWFRVILYGVVAVSIGTLLFYYRLSWLVKWIGRIPGTKRFIYLVEALQAFDNRLLTQLLVMSLLRYAVFTLQYYLLFLLFDVNISLWLACWTVSVSFLIMAIIPTIAIAELPQRGKVVTTIVGLYSVNQLGMTFATATIWFINLVFPAILGAIFMLVRKRMTRVDASERKAGTYKEES
jgi:uncharacterized membrane protein YbhN (UPF0104 family)